MQDERGGTTTIEDSSIERHNYESVTSKVFIECKKFLFIGQIVKHDGFGNYSLPFVNCGTLSFGY